MATCPYCTFDIPPLGRFCPACHLGLRFTGPDRVEQVLPQILPGRLLVSTDCRVANLPGRPEELAKHARRLSRAPQGVCVTLEDAVTPHFLHTDLDVRDACIRASFTVLDRGARIGISARRETLNTAETLYTFELAPDTGSAWISRLIIYDDPPRRRVESKNLLTVKTQAVAPFGHMNDLELRLQGTTLRAYVNRVEVLALHDPVYCTGAGGVRVGRERPKDGSYVRVIVHDFQIATVTA